MASSKESTPKQTPSDDAHRDAHRADEAPSDPEGASSEDPKGPEMGLDTTLSFHVTPPK